MKYDTAFFVNFFIANTLLYDIMYAGSFALRYYEYM